MGPYYITALVAALGSVKRVSAMSNRAFEQRVFGAGSQKGKTFHVDVDTHYSASLEFSSGAIAAVMLSFDIWGANLPHMEIYGTAGSISMPDPNIFGGSVLARGIAGDFTELPLQNIFSDNMRGIGLAQMCKAISEGGGHLANANLAAHVLEVLIAMELSAKQGVAITCETACQQPQLLPAGLSEAEYCF
jgi:predicted dehydrogenase